ncbi:MAG: hypothetical protein J6D16_00220 [Clostridia bacterium]|nr:hypothetical protein [Clostridia bacterium]
MKFESLASSSHGNAYIVSDRDTRILLECGISYKQLQKLSGFSLSEFKACIVSHEHKDHAKSVEDLIGRGMEVYMSYGTAQALEVDSASLIESMEQFNVGSFDIVPFATFHDASEPLGFLIKSRADGEVLAFATDTVNLRYKFPGLTILAIEANYDKTCWIVARSFPTRCGTVSPTPTWRSIPCVIICARLIYRSAARSIFYICPMQPAERPNL